MKRFSRLSNSRRRGLSMGEALISLAISTMLLTAIGAAFTTSSAAIQMNEDFFRASQAARVTLNQMLVEARRADALQCSAADSTYFDVIRPDETLTTGELSRRYKYDSATKQINLIISYTGGTTATYPLVHNVESAAFGPPQMGVDANNASVVQRLPVSLTIHAGSNHITLNGAASPRRAQKY